MIDIYPYHNGDQLFDNRYRFERPLGEDDSTKDVWLAIDYNTIPRNEAGGSVIDESSGLRVVIKIYQTEHELDALDEQRFQEEFKILQRCQHPNLLQPIGFSVFKGSPYLVLPYCEAGSAKKFKEEKMSRATMWKFISDVASGLDKQHGNKPQIVHRVIKPSHILIDDYGNFVVTNYGKRAQESGDVYENKGSLSYIAPERFEPHALPSPESDIWAFGATLCEILTGGAPFGEEGGKAQANESKPMPKLKGIPSSVRNLIRACLEKNPKNRPTARQIMEAAKKKRFPVKQKKPVWPIIVVVAIILVVCAVISYIIPRNSPVQPEQKTYTYDSVVVLLKDTATTREGLCCLDTLVAKGDYRATFLKSRLLFDTTDWNDDFEKPLYQQFWMDIRTNTESIVANNIDAHRLLFEAFLLDEKKEDYVMLYQLGCDYLPINKRRGTSQNLQYAKWCFHRADSILATKVDADSLYIVKIKELLEKTINDTICLEKPKQETEF